MVFSSSHLFSVRQHELGDLIQQLSLLDQGALESSTLQIRPFEFDISELQECSELDVDLLDVDLLDV